MTTKGEGGLVGERPMGPPKGRGLFDIVFY